MSKYRVAVLASGAGSNLQALIDQVHRRGVADIVLVASDNPRAGALTRARRAGIPVLALAPRRGEGREGYHRRLARAMAPYRPDLVVLAGYMRLLPREFIGQFAPIINVHPSLLPAFPGLDAPAQALAHPNWSMGPKISIDSATLMNKGLEVIEARWLFAVDPEQIEVVVHPQSIVHSLVEFRDGSVVAQMGIPDMRIPIAYALSYPERLDLGLARLNLAQCGGLVFEPPDEERFPALRLACDALAAGGVKPAVLNAANEVAVAAFLDGRITFAAIAATVAAALDQVAQADDLDLQAILDADRAARIVAARLVQDA